MKKEIGRKKVNYIEAIIFSPSEAVVITGGLSDAINLPVSTYSKATDVWFYEKAKKVAYKNKMYEELIPITDYLFRYNRGAFWMGEFVFSFLHIPGNRLTKILFNPVMNTRKLFDAMHAIKHSQNYFIQDFYCPLENSETFMKYSEEKLDIFPVWLCPIKPTENPQKLSPQYINANMLMDVGIWGQTEKFLDDPIGLNKEFESFAEKTNARKMFYAQVYYAENEFWKMYDKKWYINLRKKYHAENVFPDIWEKVHVSRKYHIQKWRGAMKILLDTMLGKNINS